MIGEGQKIKPHSGIDVVNLLRGEVPVGTGRMGVELTLEH